MWNWFKSLFGCGYHPSRQEVLYACAVEDAHLADKAISRISYGVSTSTILHNADMACTHIARLRTNPVVRRVVSRRLVNELLRWLEFAKTHGFNVQEQQEETRRRYLVES